MGTLYKLILAAVSFCFLIACTDQKQLDNSGKFIQDTTYNISGTISAPGSGSDNAQGKNVYLVINNYGDLPTTTPVKTISFTALSAADPALTSYTFDIDTGHYNFLYFIDMNGNAAFTNNLPDAGDLYTEFQISVVDLDLTFDIGEAQWHTY